MERPHHFESQHSGKKFFVADTVKHVDFVVGMYLINVVLNVNNPLHAQYTECWKNAPDNLKVYVANLQEEFKDYLASRP